MLQIEEFLWRYIEKFHADKLQSVFTPGVECTYAGGMLKVEGGHVETVTTAVEEIVTLCQKLAVIVAEETFQMPKDTHEDMLQDIAEKESLLLYVAQDGVFHVAGPKDRIPLYMQQCIVDKMTEETARNQRRIAAAANEAGDMSESMYEFVLPGGIKVEVYQGNLVAETVDAIVNPANSHLRHSGGAARAIADAAGWRLKDERKDFIRQYKRLNVTTVMHTSAGNLQPEIRYVIHAAGPRAEAFRDKEELRQALEKTFFNCLHYANDELRLCSVSIPAISSGTCYC